MTDASNPSGKERQPQAGTRSSGPEPSRGGSLVESVKETARDVASAMGGAAGQAKEKVQEWSATAITQVKDTTQEVASAAADKAADFGKELTDLVRRYPLQAVLVGVGVGFGVGLLLGRGPRS